eukprot:Protomagalhaensia_sp_Gyna_25__2273@NODE_2242_length_1198_cov_565_886109_g1858_i0_p1_GENE_NODE_2242_length_1198_cov_565_886109_g1858_i0NODE_2242_length_1198_cov_565_886109_g1858_i0_p1_ORF_typecomplete_len248_score50_58Ribosomal_L30/PF00327_20/7_3e20Ribosomal_L30_N/PF08079_12/8_4e08Macoilin/PF09726_9/0_03DUF4407/PF14362_6/0_058BMF/PF15185_6/0_32AP1AR/PF15745_5/0_36_NODE_2242_length_1198_cov_565_886109_g1858_i03691112
MTDTPVAPVPESRKLKAELDARLATEREAQRKKEEAEAAKREEALIARTLKYEAEYKQKEIDALEKQKAATAAGGYYVPEEPKIIFMIRIKGVNKLAPKPRKVLQLFRLLQLHNGVFIKVNKATLNMIKLIEPFVTYGYPSLETVRKLIYGRGYGRVGNGKARTRLQDNDIVHQALGKYGIHGVEDMIHELATCGPHFKEVNAFLHAFKLRPPRGGFVCKRHGFAEYRKGDWGNREDLINELIAKMI